MRKLQILMKMKRPRNCTNSEKLFQTSQSVCCAVQLVEAKKLKRRKRNFIDSIKCNRSVNFSSQIFSTLILSTVFIILTFLPNTIVGEPPIENGLTPQWERPAGMPKITRLEVMCGNEHMEVHLNFDKPFNGIVASKGMYGHDGCVYVPPRTGRSQFVFNIYYERCGTKPDNHGKFYENTVVVQYDEELIEAWDEAKRLRCEWFNDYEKTATKTNPMVISDLEVVELNFHGDNVDCWMEIQEGKGPWAPPLTRIVPLGTPLTMVVAVKDPSGEFDMRVKACEASDGKTGHLLPLSDAEGCILRPKLIGRFSKLRMDDPRATVLTYAYMSAFKFPDMLDVHVRCTVEICRHGCPDHCNVGSRPTRHGDHEAQYSENKEVSTSPNELNENNENIAEVPKEKPDIHEFQIQANLSPPPVQQVPQNPQNLPPRPQMEQRPPRPMYVPQKIPGHLVGPHNGNLPPMLMRPRPPPNGMVPPPPPPGYQFQHQGPPMRVPHNFPHGFTGTVKHSMNNNQPPDEAFLAEQFHRHQQVQENMRLKPEPKRDDEEFILQISGRAGELSMEEEEAETKPREVTKRENKEDEQPRVEKAFDQQEESEEPVILEEAPVLKHTLNAPSESVDRFPGIPKGPRSLRLRRAATSSSKDTIGIQGVFRVISEADVDFAWNRTTAPTAVLKGRINGNGDLIYGICLPRVGFSVLFFGLGAAAFVAILTALFLAYTYYSVHRYNNAMKMDPMMNREHFQPVIPIPMVILKKLW